MKKLIFFVFVVFFAGCASQNLKTQECNKNTSETCITINDIAGLYEANIVCTECKSAISILELNKDGTFKIETVIHKQSTQITLENGSYSTKDDEIILVNQYKEKSRYKFDGKDLRKIENKDSFVKDSFTNNLVYKSLN